MRQGSRFLILDEPTAKLNAKEIERLFIQMVTLKSVGVGILFISHHLDEIFHIADTVTVLRDGRKVLDRPIAGLDRSALIEAMVGSTNTPTVRSTAATTDLSRAPVRLEVQDLSCKGFFEAVSFRVRTSECVGLAGLTGSGKEVIGEVLAGLKDFDAGTIRLVPCRASRWRMSPDTTAPD